MRESESGRRLRFDALFASYNSDIVAYCGWRAVSASDAQDAVADVFLTAWRRLEELPEGDAARVWLYATARKVIANQRRSRRRRAALHERLAAEALPRTQRWPPTGRKRSSTRPSSASVHDEAADPAAPLVATVAVSADGIVREIAVTWGTRASTWRYTVEYRDLGATAAPVAPENARPLRDRNPG